MDCGIGNENQGRDIEGRVFTSLCDIEFKLQGKN